MMSHMAHKTDHTTLERFATGRVDTLSCGGLAPAPFRATRFNSDMRMHEYVADEKTRRPDRRALFRKTLVPKMLAPPRWGGADTQLLSPARRRNIRHRS